MRFAPYVAAGLTQVIFALAVLGESALHASATEIERTAEAAVTVAAEAA
jgi:hypothetical protein